MNRQILVRHRTRLDEPGGSRPMSWPARGALSAFLILLLALAHAAPLAAQNKLPKALQDVRIDQRLNDPIPLDLVFHDETGREVRLGDYFHGQPVILVPAYYRCPRLCTEILSGLTVGLQKLSFEMGEQYSVVTFSFDPGETTELAAKKKEGYAKLYGRPGAEENWHFLTGDKDSITALADAIGYHYTYDPKTNLFAHASGIMILTPEGKISRYFYGVEFPPGDVRLGLVEASQGQIGSPVDQVRLFCFHYDPSTGKYTPAVLNLVRLGGALTVLALGAVFGLLWIRGSRRSRRLHKTPNPA